MQKDLEGFHLGQALEQLTAIDALGRRAKASLNPLGMSSPLPPDPKRTVQLSVRWAVSTCLVVLGVAAVTFFVFSTQLAIIITLGASMVALALEHLVRLFMRRGLHRPWAIAAVIGVVLLFLTGVVLLLAPPVVSEERMTGLRFPAGDASALAAAIVRLFSVSEASRRAIGARGRAWASANFNPAVVREQTLALYEAVGRARTRH